MTTIANAIDDVNAHIEAIVALCSDFYVMDRTGDATFGSIEHGELITSDSLGLIVEAALRTKISGDLGFRL
jgi:hypothetical protein